MTLIALFAPAARHPRPGRDRSELIAISPRAPCARSIWRTGGEVALGALDGHRHPRPRRLQPGDLRRPRVADRGRRGRGAERRRRPRDRPGRGLPPLARCDRHAGHGRPDGDPLDPARDRPGLALGRRARDRADRDRDPGDPARRPPGPLDRAVGSRGALRRGGDRARHGRHP